MTENDVKRDVIDYLVLTGWLVLRVNSGAFGGEYTDKRGQTRKRFLRFVRWFAGGVSSLDGEAGCSDILAIKDGVCLAVETKRPGEVRNVSEAQKKFLAEWHKHGGIWCVAQDVQDVITALGVRNDTRLAH